MKSFDSIAMVVVCLSVTPLWAQTTRIQENDPSITYTGMWYTNGESPNSGGQAYLTNAKGAQAVITFTGTGITWIGVEDPYSGLATVYLDGTPNTVDSYAANTEYQQPIFSVHGLAAGTHTLSIQVLHQRDEDTSGSWVWIDAFDIENGSGIPGGVSATTGRVEQNDPSVSYNGNWYVNTNPIQSGGTAVLAMDAASRATINFTGSGIRWIAYRDPWSGIANIYIDGTLVTTVDTYTAVQQSQAIAYDSGTLTTGQHTLTVEATGTRDSSSGGNWIWVDAFDIR